MINYSERYIDMLLDEYSSELMLGANPYHAFRRMLTLHEREQAAVWDTTCSGCARLLDRLYQQEEVDKADPV